MAPVAALSASASVLSSVNSSAPLTAPMPNAPAAARHRDHLQQQQQPKRQSATSIVTSVGPLDLSQGIFYPPPSNFTLPFFISLLSPLTPRLP